ncbi:MAG TPA: protein kinase, partial [Gemmataceae bacterium]|nr:protein kinase [Gemmataceae bacterium]
PASLPHPRHLQLRVPWHMVARARMDLTLAQLSLPGPVRSKNEDYVECWRPPDAEEERRRGTVVLLADGIGGQGKGEVASKLAVETALARFREARPDTVPNTLLWQMFSAANLAVYDAGMGDRDGGRMGTTLTVSLFRNDEVTVGHVGDCRVYLVQNGRIRRLTADHSYVGMQLKLGLITEQEAMNSQFRNLLTRSVGKEPVVQVDFYSTNVHPGDVLVQCCDGLHGCVAEHEILEIVSKQPPAEACRLLVELAEKRETTDNVSVQVVRVERVEQLLYYRGLPVYQETPDLTMTTEVQVGQVLDNRFHILNVISRSGMASIFKAADLQTGRTVAVKVPFMQFESDPGFFSRFEREEAIGKLLDHPYILHIVPVEEKSRPYIAMEYLEGETLRHLMRSVRPLPVPDALRIAGRVCEALDYMHKKDVVHRDLKPENVMLCSDGSLRIMDFGIAKAAGMRRLTFAGLTSAMGTPDYMAPEQVKGRRGDQRTDLYSLGAILYEMVTGSAPFEGANPYMIMNARLIGDPVAPRKLNPQISPQVEEIILHAMERDPALRYASAAALKADLDNPEQVEVTGRSQRLRPPAVWRTRWRGVRNIVIAALVPVIVFGILFLLLFRR